MMRKGICCIVLCIVLLFTLAVSVRAAELDSTQSIIRDLISYYFHYREQAAEEIDNQLQTLSSLDPKQGEIWREIMESWSWINEEMTVHTGVLPDGLPTDDSLCIVVLGYGLNEDGSMKQELLDRLEVALISAQKYPQAYVLCTGGETSYVPGISEAGKMCAWLQQQGVEETRLIAETESLSTTANAQNSCRLLWRQYPQVRSIAIVSSDYHIRWSSVCFNTMVLWGAGYQGEKKLELVANAGCVTGTPGRDTMHSQAWGISIIAGVPFDGEMVPALYLSGEDAIAETDPVALLIREPIAADSDSKEPIVPVLLGLVLVAVCILIPKKKRK